MSYKFELIADIAYLQPLSLHNPEENKTILTLIDIQLQTGYNQWIIDLSELNYINSTGLNLLISALSRVRAKSGEIVLLGVSNNIQQVLVLTRLQTLFEIKESKDEAIATFTKREKI